MLDAPINSSTFAVLTPYVFGCNIKVSNDNIDKLTLKKLFINITINLRLT